ncbi:MAG TPA: hypothetical protein VFP88_03580 [Rhodanobacteraceae bacterium]|nr:hypothetical protein [Rhodanobacteraceae bacterium]
MASRYRTTLREIDMKRLLTLVALATLQGCASMAGNGPDQNFSSLKLFGADGQPRFVVDLACAGKSDDSTMQCQTVHHVFYDWSQDRHVTLHHVGMDDAAFQTGRSASAQQTAGKPYVLAIRFEPIVTPGYHSWSGNAGTQSSGFIPGRVGYEASVIVFSASTGAVVQKLSPHHQEQVPEHTNLTPAMKADVYSVIARIDPAYSHR